MKRLLYYTEIILLLTGVWIILNERLGVIQVLTGLFISIISIIFTDYYLLLGDYKNAYQIPPHRLIKYILYLIFQIYISGITTIVRMLSEKSNVGIVDFETVLDNELYICLLANAITLTPGTVTLDKSGQRLKVLCLHCPEAEEGAVESVKSSFEKILLGR